MEILDQEFERFLSNKMPPEEHLSFKIAMENDSEILEAFESYVLLQKVKEHTLKQATRAKAKASINEHIQKKKASRRRWILTASALAASILIGIFFIFQLFNTSKKVSVAELIQKDYLDNSKLALALTNPLQTLSVGDSIIQQTLLHLKEQKYTDAINSIDALTESNPDYTRMQLLKGFCHLQLQGYTLALEEIRKVKEQNKNIYLKEEAEWLEILTLLLEGPKNNIQAKELLIHIKQTVNHKYKADAKQFYQHLN